MHHVEFEESPEENDDDDWQLNLYNVA
jgi:hypothetical protein